MNMIGHEVSILVLFRIESIYCLSGRLAEEYWPTCRLEPSMFSLKERSVCILSVEIHTCSSLGLLADSAA